jgi:cytochrome c556
MNRKLVLTGVAVVLGASCVLSAFAQVRPEALVKQRQAAMTLQGKYWYRQLRPTGQGKIPYDAATVAHNVMLMDALSQIPWDGFAATTKDVKSDALPAVFSEPAKFKEAQDTYRSEMTKLVDAVKGGNEAAVKAQILTVNKSCDSCHDNFRSRD